MIYLCFHYDTLPVMPLTDYADITLQALGLRYYDQEPVVAHGSVLVYIRCPAYVRWLILAHQEEILNTLAKKGLTKIYECFISDVDASLNQQDDEEFLDELMYLKEQMISDGIEERATPNKFQVAVPSSTATSAENTADDKPADFMTGKHDNNNLFANVQLTNRTSGPESEKQTLKLAQLKLISHGSLCDNKANKMEQQQVQVPNVVPILQKAGPLSREDNTAIHNAFIALLKVEQKPEALVKAFCDVRIPFVFEAMRMYIRLNKVNATKHFGQCLLPFGQDLVQMASYNEEDSWTLCAYVVQASMDKLISAEDHVYFSDLVYMHLLELDRLYVELYDRCRVQPHTHEWCDSKGFVTSPPNTLLGNPIFVGSVIDETQRRTPIQVRENFGGMNFVARFQSILSHINDLFTNFDKLYTTVHTPCWKHAHYWKCKGVDGRKKITVAIPIEVLPNEPTPPQFNQAISVYDLPAELTRLSQVLDHKLAQPVAPHTHAMKGKKDSQDLCLFLTKDSQGLCLFQTEKKGIGAVKSVEQN